MYPKLGIFYNFYDCKFISLQQYDALRTELGVTLGNLKGTYLYLLDTSSKTNRPKSNPPGVKGYLNYFKTPATDNLPNYQLHRELLIYEPCQKLLKSMLIKLAKNTFRETEVHLPLHYMLEFYFPAHLISSFYKQLNVKRPNNNFGIPDKSLNLEPNHLPYLLSIEDVLRPLFPQSYIFSLVKILLRTPYISSQINVIVAKIVEVHNSFPLDSPEKFKWFEYFTETYRSHLAETQLEFVLEVFAEYMQVHGPTPKPLHPISHQMMIVIARAERICWRAAFFIWFVHDDLWVHRENNTRILAHLRRGNLHCALFPFDVIVEMQNYLRKIPKKMRVLYQISVAKFLATITAPEYWDSKTPWQDSRSYEFVKQFLVCVAKLGDPDDIRKCVGIIYYPREPPQEFLTLVCDLQSKDPDVIRYNYLKTTWGKPKQ